MEKIRRNRIEHIASCYCEAITYQTVSITYGPNKTIEIVGKDSLMNLNLALTSMQAQGLVQTRVRDKHKVCHYVSESELKSIIGQGAVWGDRQWNKKVDLQEQIMAVNVANYATEQDAINAINAINWS